MIRHYSNSSSHKKLQHSTITLWDDMVSPLCGILNSLFTFLRQTYDPKIIAIGGQLSDPTALLGIYDPVTYHIGGMGVSRDDAMIKCLAESYERYISFVYQPKNNMMCFMGSYHELKIKYPSDSVPEETLFNYFSDEQYKRENFFSKFSGEMPFLWVKLKELTKNGFIWLPAQLLFLGYVIKKELGEKRINSAISTGTAVHRDITSCLFNSMMEMILIDAVMGHWYTTHQAYKIEMDNRTRHVRSILQKSIPNNNFEIEFYWIPSKEFPTFNVACISHNETIPQFCIGLGADTHLEGAMYKAYLEFIGTRFLSQTLSVLHTNDIDPQAIKNLDENVLYYALGHNKKRINQRFNNKKSLKASDLPPDMGGDKQTQLKSLINLFSELNKNIALIDMTNDESRELGLVATKLWSPQLVSLCLPNTVPMNHQRLKQYGDIVHVDPHPYP